MSLLLQDELLEAMNRDRPEERLVVCPLLESKQVGVGTVDLRLGTQFIEAQRWTEAGIDPLMLKSRRSARTQTNTRPVPDGNDEQIVFIPLGESFVLHPGQFVLGATLEFIRLPRDISGQVVGRSSWGRLGLIVATAVVVQPCFTGVLTLELVNTGNVPVHLYPGLRVAQLQLWKATRPAPSPRRRRPHYAVPLGPESVHVAWQAGEVTKIRSLGKSLSGS
jgi:dCTP deaminase